MQNKIQSILAFVALAMCMFAASAEVIVPKPAAVWDGDFGSAANVVTNDNGYILNTEYVLKSKSSITIGGKGNEHQGILFWSTNSMKAVTVLVKYSNLERGEVNRVIFAVTSNNDYHYDRCGALLTTTNTINGIWNPGNSASGSVEDPLPNAGYGSIVSSGVMAFVHNHIKMALYNSTDGVFDSETWSDDLSAGNIYGVSIGGKNFGSEGMAESAIGMTISGLAVFTNVLNVAQMNDYSWPNSDETVESILAKQLGADALAELGVDLEEGETIAEALAKHWGNDLTAWQNIVLGISKDDATAGKLPFVAPVQNAEPGQLSFSVGNYTPNNNLVGKTAKFTVYEVDENGNEVETEGKLVSEETDLGKSATIPTTGIDGVRYFKIRIKF